MRESKVKTPELDKVRAAKPKSQAIGDFIEWLEREKHIELCVRQEFDHRIQAEELVPCGIPMQRLLAEHFGIDLVKVEEEKQALLEELAGEAE